MTMEDVAAHLRSTWSALGLEVRGCGVDRVHLAVGPGFPVSRLCADAAAVYDAEVWVHHDSDTGTSFVVVPHKVAPVRTPRCWVMWLAFGIVAIGFGTALWAFDETDGLAAHNASL